MAKNLIAINKVFTWPRCETPRRLLCISKLSIYSSSGNPGSAAGAVQGDDKWNEFSHLFMYTNSPKTALSEPFPQEVQWILSSCEKLPFTAKVIHMRQTLFYILNITLTSLHFKYYKHYYMQWCLRPIMFSFSFSFSGKNEQNNSLVPPSCWRSPSKKSWVRHWLVIFVIRLNWFFWQVALPIEITYTEILAKWKLLRGLIYF